MSILGTIAVKLTADTAAFAKGMQAATDSTKGFAEQAASMAKVSTAAFAGLTGALGLATRAATIQKEAELKLASAIRGSGQAIDSEKIKAYASELQKVTTFGDEVTINAAAMLATFQLQEDQIIGLLPKVQNLSAAYGMDLQTAAISVGKAISIGSGALSRFGIVLSDEEKKAFDAANQTEKVALMMSILEKNTGPAAQMMAQTAGGAFKQLTNAMGDTLEQIGFILEAPLAAIFQEATSAVTWLTDEIQSWDEETKNTVATVALVSTAVIGVTAAISTLVALTPAVVAFFSPFLTILPIVILIAANIAAFIALLGAMSKSGALEKIGEAFEEIKKTISKMIDGAKEFFRLVTTGSVEDKSPMALEPVVKPQKEQSFMEFVGESFKEGLDVLGLDSLSEKFGSLGDATDDTSKSTAAMGDAQKIHSDAAKAMASALRRAAGHVESFDFTVDPEFFDEAGQEISEEIAAAAEGEAGQKSAFFGSTGKRLAGKAEAGGQVAMAAVEGFQQAGIWGALAGVLAELMQEMTWFGEMVNIGNQTIGIMAEELSELFEHFKPMTKSVAVGLVGIVKFIGAIARLSETFDYASEIFNWVAEKLASIFNWMIRVWNKMINFVADIVSQIPVKGESWAAKIRKGTMEEIQPFVDSMDDLTEKTKDAAEAAEGLTESLLNAPQGFKIAAYRFNAESAVSPVPLGLGGASPQMPTVDSGRTVTIGTVNVQAENPTELFRAIEREAEFNRFATTGSTQRPGGSFSNVRPK